MLQHNSTLTPVNSRRAVIGFELIGIPTAQFHGTIDCAGNGPREGVVGEERSPAQNGTYRVCREEKPYFHYLYFDPLSIDKYRYTAHL